MHRSVPLALALVVVQVVLLAACDGSSAEECPGAEIADFTFAGDRRPAGDPSIAPLDPVPAVPDCEAAVGYPAALAPFPGTLSAGPTPLAAALCRSGTRVMFGTRTGDRIAVETTTDGAVLDGCGGCPARLRLVVVGDVLPGGAAPATGFSGALVEVLSPADGPCTACALPCAARYALAGSLP